MMIAEHARRMLDVFRTRVAPPAGWDIGALSLVPLVRLHAGEAIEARFPSVGMCW